MNELNIFKTLLEEMKNDKNLSINDLKSLYILDFINKNYKISGYYSLSMANIPDEKIKESIKSSMFFNDSFYNLYFKYNNTIFRLYRDNIAKPIELHYLVNEEMVKEELYDITLFVNGNKEYTKEEIINIKNNFIKTINDKINNNLQRNNEIKNILYELMEE